MPALPSCILPGPEREETLPSGGMQVSGMRFQGNHEQGALMTSLNTKGNPSTGRLGILLAFGAVCMGIGFAIGAVVVMLR